MTYYDYGRFYDDSDEDAMRKQSDLAAQEAQAWAAKVAKDALAIANDIGNALDQWDEHWKPENLADLEYLHYELMGTRERMIKVGLMKKPHD